MHVRAAERSIDKTVKNQNTVIDAESEIAKKLQVAKSSIVPIVVADFPAPS